MSQRCSMHHEIDCQKQYCKDEAKRHADLDEINERSRQMMDMQNNLLITEIATGLI